MVMDTDPRHLFVQLSNLHGFIEVDYAARKTVRTVNLPAPPAGAKRFIPLTFAHGMAVTPDHKTLWVCSQLSNSVSVYSLPDLRLIGTTPVGIAPDWMAIAPDGKRAYVQIPARILYRCWTLHRARS